MSSQSIALLYGQDLRPQAEQGVGLCFSQEGLQQRVSPMPISPHGSNKL